MHAFPNAIKPNFVFRFGIMVELFLEYTFVVIFGVSIYKKRHKFEDTFFNPQICPQCIFVSSCVGLLHVLIMSLVMGKRRSILGEL